MPNQNETNRETILEGELTIISEENAYSLSQLEQDMQPVLSVVDSSNIIVFDDHKQAYSLTNYEELEAQANALKEKAAHYIYQEEDRKNVKSLRASINKFSSRLNKEVINFEKSLTSDLRKEQKTISSILSDAVEMINRGIDNEDKRFKQEKLEFFTNEFEDAKSSFDFIKDLNLSYDRISKNSWLNRSASQNKVIKEIHQKLDSLNHILSHLDKENYEVNDNLVERVLTHLTRNNDDSLVTLTSVKDEIAYEEEKAERLLKEKEQREKEKKEKEQLEELRRKENEGKKVHLIIELNDFERIKKTLNRMGIEYEIKEEK